MFYYFILTLIFKLIKFGKEFRNKNIFIIFRGDVFFWVLLKTLVGLRTQNKRKKITSEKIADNTAFKGWDYINFRVKLMKINFNKGLSY